MTEMLLYLVLHLGGLAPAPELDDQLRPVSLFGRTVHESCNRAGVLRARQLRDGVRQRPPLPRQARLQGAGRQVQRAVRGWVNGIGGCPNVGGICMACTMPGFPDKYMPFMEEDAKGRISANVARFTYGPVPPHLRNRTVKKVGDNEPAWRKRGSQLTSGYQKRW